MHMMNSQYYVSAEDLSTCMIIMKSQYFFLISKEKYILEEGAKIVPKREDSKMKSQL